MVRLKGIFVTSADRRKPFQFQYGTIKSHYAPVVVVVVVDFNSSMVRLKADRRFQKNI